MSVRRFRSLADVMGTSMSDVAGLPNGLENKRLALLIFTAA